MNKISFTEYEIFGMKLPIILNVILVFFLLSTAFLFGVVSFLGVGLLPLINTVEIYFLFSFYASVFALLIRMCFLIFVYVKEQNKLSFRLLDRYLSKNFFNQAHKNRKIISIGEKYSFYFIMILMICFVLYSIYLSLEFDYLIQQQFYNQIYDLSLSAFLILLLGIACYYFLSLRKVLLILVLLQCLSFFFQCGKAWISYHKNSESSVNIIYKDNTSEEGNILFRSSIGILVYIENNPKAQFINLNEVRKIEAKFGSEIDFRSNDFVVFKYFIDWWSQD